MSCEFYHCKFSEIDHCFWLEIEVNDELRGMLSGNFDDTSPVVVEDQEEAPVFENKYTEDAGDQVICNLPEHRFVQKEQSEKISLFIGDYIFRRRYVRKDWAVFTCTGCEKILKG